MGFADERYPCNTGKKDRSAEQSLRRSHPSYSCERRAETEFIQAVNVPQGALFNVCNIYLHFDPPLPSPAIFIVLSPPRDPSKASSLIFLLVLVAFLPRLSSIRNHLYPRLHGLNKAIPSAKTRPMSVQGNWLHSSYRCFKKACSRPLVFGLSCMLQSLGICLSARWKEKFEHQLVDVGWDG